MSSLTDHIRAAIQPHELEPEEQEQRARHLIVAIRLTIPTLILGAVVTGLSGEELAVGTVVALGPVLWAYLLAQSGRSLLASRVLMGTVLILSHTLLNRYDGLQDVAVLIYPVLVLVASLLLGPLEYIVLVLLSMASLGVIAYGQATGSVRVVSESLRAMIPHNVVMANVIIGAAAVMSRMMVQDMRRSARQARRNEQALSSSEERYRLISQVISDYSFSTVVEADGSIRLNWVAGAFERITGYTFDEYQERGGWYAALHPDDRAQDARDRETLRANKPMTSEVRTFTRSGALRWVRVYGHPVWSEEEQRLVGIYGAVQDITERKQIEAEREKLIGELEAKNAELERFTYTASHDLKSPLVTVRGFLDFIERDAIDGNHERVKADLSRIRDATSKMQRLLDELLELSRVGRVLQQPTPVAFGELAKEAVGLLAASISERGVAVEIGDNLPLLWGDGGRLLQVVQNLVDNAVKFMGDQSEPHIEIGARHADGERVLFVKDNGMGIAEGDRDRVFGLFDKLNPDSRGTGVGLALVQRIVNLHGGRVWVESDGLGKGATFCLTVAERPPEAPGDGLRTESGPAESPA